jgi:hypothetical protein
MADLARAKAHKAKYYIPAKPEQTSEVNTTAPPLRRRRGSFIVKVKGPELKEVAEAALDSDAGGGFLSTGDEDEDHDSGPSSPSPPPLQKKKAKPIDIHSEDEDAAVTLPVPNTGGNGRRPSPGSVGTSSTITGKWSLVSL